MANYHVICDPANENFRLENSAFYLVAHADYQYHEDLAKVLAKYGMDRTIYRLFTVSRNHSPVNIGVLSERALLKRSTTSRAVERMRKEGWVKTVANSKDSRIIDVHFTTKGTHALEKVIHLGSKQFHRAMEGLSSKQLEQFVNTLHHIINNLSRLPIE